MAIEYRDIPQATLTSKTNGDDDSPIITGMVAPYWDGNAGTEFELWAGAVERFAPGCFSESLKGDIRILWNHNAEVVLGRTKANTAEVWEDSDGVYYSVNIGKSSKSRDVYDSVKRGDVSGSSVGMRVVEDRWHMEDGKDVRTIVRADMVEASVVAFPAYEATTCVARNTEGAKESLREAQELQKRTQQAIKEMMDASERFLAIE